MSSFSDYNSPKSQVVFSLSKYNTVASLSCLQCECLLINSSCARRTYSLYFISSLPFSSTFFFVKFHFPYMDGKSFSIFNKDHLTPFSHLFWWTHFKVPSTSFYTQLKTTLSRCKLALHRVVTFVECFPIWARTLSTTAHLWRWLCFLCSWIFFYTRHSFSVHQLQRPLKPDPGPFLELIFNFSVPCMALYVSGFILPIEVLLQNTPLRGFFTLNHLNSKICFQVSFIHLFNSFLNTDHNQKVCLYFLYSLCV